MLITILCTHNRDEVIISCYLLSRHSDIYSHYVEKSNWQLYQRGRLPTVLQNRRGISVVNISERDAINTEDFVAEPTTQNTSSHTETGW